MLSKHSGPVCLAQAGGALIPGDVVLTPDLGEMRSSTSDFPVRIQEKEYAWRIAIGSNRIHTRESLASQAVGIKLYLRLVTSLSASLVVIKNDLPASTPEVLQFMKAHTLDRLFGADAEPLGLDPVVRVKENEVAIADDPDRICEPRRARRCTFGVSRRERNGI